MKRIKNVKVFDMNNPNINTLNSIEDIKDMFILNNIPIVKYITENNNTIDFNRQKYIGVITNPIIYNTDIIGDCLIYDENENINGEFVNYEVQGKFVNNDRDYLINSIMSVEIK